MIINEKFTLKRDLYSWQLTYTYLGEDIEGNPKYHTKESWHSTIKQAANKILNYEAGEADTITAFIEKLDRAEDILEPILKERLKDERQKALSN